MAGTERPHDEIRKLDKEFTTRLQKSPAKGGQHLCRLARVGRVLRDPGSGEGPGTIDGHPFQGSFMAIGDGMHKLPFKADVRKAISKQAGDTVTVVLEERIDTRR